MARQTSFGEALAHARERKGLDLSTAARKLRIRPDILRAIEEGDFARMPPRGYTSNMVGAYARLVGLNPTEVTRAYREEVYQFETGRRPASNRRERPRDAGRTVALPSSRDRGSSRAPAETITRARRALAVPAWAVPRPAPGRAAPQPQYTNLVQGRQAPGIAANIGSYLPLIIVGAIIVGLLVLVIDPGLRKPCGAGERCAHGAHLRHAEPRRHRYRCRKRGRRRRNGAHPAARGADERQVQLQRARGLKRLHRGRPGRQDRGGGRCHRAQDGRFRCDRDAEVRAFRR